MAVTASWRLAILVVFIILAAGHAEANQWATIGNNIYNTNSGNVGIGTTSPTQKLDVAGPVLRSEFSGNTLDLIPNYLGASFISTSSLGGAPPPLFLVPPVVDFTGNVGIGANPPGGRLHVLNALNTVGSIFALPPIASLPDPSYKHKAVMQWEGGEAKFGKWRQYFNTWENDWALSYNTPYDPVTNTYGGRDSGDSRANITAVMRFDVAEGDSGVNHFEIHFAPPAAAGTPPDFNAASSLILFDGRRGDASTSRPALLAVGGPNDVDTALSLANGLMGVRLMVDGVTPYPNMFRIRDESTGTDYLTIKTPSGNVGIGTTSPAYRLQVGDAGDGTQARANAWNLLSSKAYKTGIQRLTLKDSERILEKVKALDVVRYRFKRDPEHTEHIGVLAEEAPKEIVSKDGAAVSLGDYTAFLLAAVKAQQAKIEELEARVLELAERKQKGCTMASANASGRLGVH